MADLNPECGNGGGQVWAKVPEPGDAPKHRSKATTASASQLKPLGWTALLASSASAIASPVMIRMPSVDRLAMRSLR